MAIHDNIVVAPVKLRPMPKKEARAGTNEALAGIGLPDKAEEYLKMFGEVPGIMCKPATSGITMAVMAREMGLAGRAATRVLCLWMRELSREKILLRSSWRIPGSCTFAGFSRRCWCSAEEATRYKYENRGKVCRRF